MQSYLSPSIWNYRKISFPQILPHKGKEWSFLPLKCTTFLPCWSFRTWGNFLPLKYKAMGKESNFLFSLNTQLSPTWGRSKSLESKLSFSTKSSPKCKAILPYNFTNPSHSICREGFVLIMQNLYKSFPTNESLLFLFFSSSSFFILCLFHFILFIFFLIFFLFLLRVFFFFFFF